MKDQLSTVSSQFRIPPVLWSSWFPVIRSNVYSRTSCEEINAALLSRSRFFRRGRGGGREVMGYQYTPFYSPEISIYLKYAKKLIPLYTEYQAEFRAYFGKKKKKKKYRIP